jgi:hypothetical protein
MKTTQGQTLFQTFLLLAGSAPLALGETSFASLAVQTKMSVPLDLILPAELSFNADFVLTALIDPGMAAQPLRHAHPVRAQLGADSAGGMFCGAPGHGI